MYCSPAADILTRVAQSGSLADGAEFSPHRNEPSSPEPRPGEDGENMSDADRGVLRERKKRMAVVVGVFCSPRRRWGSP